MELDEVQRRLLEDFGIRVEPEMAKYFLSRLKAGGKKVEIIGGDARTGMPMRKLIDVGAFAPANPVVAMPIPAPIPDSLFPQ